MVLYRLSRQKYAKTLDGLGAKLYPGRWNSLDVPEWIIISMIAFIGHLLWITKGKKKLIKK
jgi:hypothetical protein